MNLMKKTLSLALCLIMALSVSTTAFAADVSESWQNKWADYDKNIAPAVTMFPGKSESERYIAWYSSTDEGYVKLISEGETKKYTATATAVPNGTYRLGAVITDLVPGTYSYTCTSSDWISEKYTFTVEKTDKITAMYVSDIHMAIEDNNDNSLAERSYIYNDTLSAAIKQAKANGDGMDIIISGGDQASGGYLEELTAMSAPEYMKTIPFAPAVGNHDRKSVGYKYYNFLPNQMEMTFKSYIGTDYWVRYGDALFLIFDSCNTSMRGHYRFVESATKANEDATWLIAVMHHDMFGGREPWLNTENIMLRLLWTPLFDEYGVDMCLYGHSHYYSVSDVIYNNKTALDLEGKTEITDPAGTVYLSTGSVNNFAPLLDDDGNVPPVGEHAAFTYLKEEEPLYSLLTFTEKTLVLNSYAVDDGENIYSLTINKSDKQGGHTYKNTKWYLKGFTCFVSVIVNIINNYDMFKRYKDQGFDVTVYEGLIGS